MKENSLFTGPIIKSKKIDYWLSNQAIFTRTKKEVKKILKDARDDGKKIKDKAFIQGLKEGQEAEKEQLFTIIEKLEKNIDKIEYKLPSLVSSCIDTILDELDTTTLIKSAVQKAMNTIKNENSITLLTAPNTVDIINDLIKNKQIKSPKTNLLNVIADSNLRSGDCILESETGVFDGRLHIQLETLKNILHRELSNL